MSSHHNEIRRHRRTVKMLVSDVQYYARSFPKGVTELITRAYETFEPNTSASDIAHAQELFEEGLRGMEKGNLPADEFVAEPIRLYVDYLRIHEVDEKMAEKARQRHREGRRQFLRTVFTPT